MAKGIKKIKFVKGEYFPKMTVANQRITIPADKTVNFDVAEWLPDTTAEDKKKPIIWMRQSSDRKIIIKQIPSTTGYSLVIDKKYCGSYQFYIEASLSGKRDFKNNVGLYVKGHCDPKIITSKWTTQRGSKSSIKNKNKTKYISYGHIVYLNLSTEGLNGRTVIVELYNQQYAKKDKPIHVYMDVAVMDGEVNMKIQNTYSWMAYVDNIQNVEEFYVKVKDPVSNKYLVDNLGDDLHAIYLNVKNKVVTTNTNVSQNQTPTKVYVPDVNAARIEPCKFEVIKITESDIKDGKAINTTVKVFNNGIGVSKLKGGQEKIERTIFFKFDGTIIDKDGEAILNNILKFLLEHKDSTMNLSGHACVIGKQNYNKGLSQRRADVIKKFFADGGLEAGRINSVGKGEVDPTDDKMGKDNIRFKNERDYENNRRVDISFLFNAHDAQTIIYDVVAPSISTKKDLLVDVSGFDIKSCFRANNKHKKEIYVVDVGQAIDKGDTKQSFSTPSFTYKVYSDLSKFNLFPIQYIWPMATTPNQFHFHAHTCRYFSNEKRTTVLLKAYPDVKWDFNFFLNLTNDLSVKGQNIGGSKLVDFHKRSGKIGAERRWKQKDASFGISLKGEWDQDKKGLYSRNNEFKTEYETKFKMLYDTFSSIGAIADGITSKTKGGVRGVGLKGLPVTFAVKPPNLKFGAVWNLERAKIKNKEIQQIGTHVKIDFGAHPLIGIEMTIDLLGSLVVGAGAFFSGGAATQATQTLYDSIMSAIKKGGKVGNDNIGANIEGDVYIDLVVSSTIETGIGFEFNTVSDKSDTKVKVEGTNKLKVEIKAGAYLKAEIVIVVITASGYFEAKASGSASITFGHSVNYDTEGLYYKPMLGFDGLIVEYSVSGKAGLAYKKKVPRMNDTKSKTKKDNISIGDESGGTVFLNDTILLVPKFDVIEEMEKLFKIKVQIPIIKNN
ncbi:OmpA family protein [Kaistella sp. G5-32]|uniref:OmpA family protein n=1 Tax=Kaistella gelatinilytica TaxID=2787636 RepID=A0ABS0F789_9FLAO|nr:OmpA family protein [Kaistella gelatinilytica]MBF8455568.1 OmpA family protein [Kaistella gelatinilytica]